VGHLTHVGNAEPSRQDSSALAGIPERSIGRVDLHRSVEHEPSFDRRSTGEAVGMKRYAERAVPLREERWIEVVAWLEPENVEGVAATLRTWRASTRRASTCRASWAAISGQ